MAQGSETIGPDLGLYRVDYQYAPIDDPNLTYDTYADFWANESANASHVIVTAEQTQVGGAGFNILTPQVFVLMMIPCMKFVWSSLCWMLNLRYTRIQY